MIEKPFLSASMSGSPIYKPRPTSFDPHYNNICLDCGEPPIDFSKESETIFISIRDPKWREYYQMSIHYWLFNKDTKPRGYEWVRGWLYCRTHFEGRADRQPGYIALTIDANPPPPLPSLLVRIYRALIGAQDREEK